MDLENIMLSERRETQEATYHFIHFYEMPRIGKSTDRKQVSDCQGRGGKESEE